MRKNAILLLILLVYLGSNYSYAQKQNESDFVPKGYVIFDKIYGDLNKDGIKDCVLIVKGTDENLIFEDEYRGELDRNRRGIIVLLFKNGKYELASRNYECFSSENEDGGGYYAPELEIEIKKGILYFNYRHGRYGYWKYTFRYQNSNFELIGFNSSQNNGPIVNKQISINFLTKKKLEINNINENTEDSGDEIFEETWSNIDVKNLIKLSEVEDFDDLFYN